MRSDALPDAARVPLVPLTVSVLLPFLALGEVLAVSVAFWPLVFAIVTDDELSERDSPVLEPLALNPTLPVNPFCGTTVTV